MDSRAAARLIRERELPDKIDCLMRNAGEIRAHRCEPVSSDHGSLCDQEGLPQ